MLSQARRSATYTVCPILESAAYSHHRTTAKGNLPNAICIALSSVGLRTPAMESRWTNKWARRRGLNPCLQHSRADVLTIAPQRPCGNCNHLNRFSQVTEINCPSSKTMCPLQINSIIMATLGRVQQQKSFFFKWTVGTLFVTPPP